MRKKHGSIQENYVITFWISATLQGVLRHHFLLKSDIPLKTGNAWNWTSASSI